MLKGSAMDHIFKQKLLKQLQPNKPKTFREALFPQGSWLSESSNLKKVDQIPEEKKIIIESLEKFAEAKLSETPSGVLKLDGGELHRKISSIDELIGSLQLSEEDLNVLIKSKIKGSIKLMFITESLRSQEEAKSEFSEGLINELILCFPKKTAEFFERMIRAMNLQNDQILVYPIESANGFLDQDILKIVEFFKVDIVVTLGAKAANKILNTNGRLTAIHGQFFNKKASSNYEFQVVPLFHPSIIETNQNMKKTAWVDMQKIMKLLEKV
jgi:uracil-DNA glycosylase family 4